MWASNEREPAVSVTTTYRVPGMSCQHCVDAVSGELTKVPGVASVAVDLSSGTVSITSSATLDFEAVRAAVDEAGYDVSP